MTYRPQAPGTLITTGSSQAENDPKEIPDHLAQFERGNQTFARLFTRWMDTNGWSHPTTVALAKSAMHGASWLHSSQIAGFRHCKLPSPGPRTFVAIERLNFYLHRYATKKLLIPGTPSSNLYAKAYVITEDGVPPAAGWWMEVFCGLRVPKDIDLYENVFNDDQAAALSTTWGGLIRKLMLSKGMDIIVELDKVIREHYPVKEPERVGLLVDVIHNRSTWTPEQFAAELPAISALTAEMGGPASEDELIEALRS